MCAFHASLSFVLPGGRRGGSRAIAPRRCSPNSSFSQTGTIHRSGNDGERRHPGLARQDECDRSRRRIEAHRRRRTPSTARGSASAGRSATSRASSPATSATDTSRVGLYATCPSMPGMIAGPRALECERPTAPHRHAVARRRMPDFKHAGDDAQRLDGRHARRDRDGTSAQEPAARRHARSAIA